MPYLSKDTLKENSPRLVALLISNAALYFAIKSILENENSENATNYNIANMIGPIGGIFNMLGRIHDHWPHPEKYKNIVAGAMAIFMMALQVSFSAASVLTRFNQPIALPLLFSSFCMAFVSGLNWESLAANDEDKSCKALACKNAGRLASFTGIAAGMSFAVPATVYNNSNLFFAANTGMSFANVFDSSNRVFDILVTHKDKTNLLNKSCAVLFLLGISSGTVANIFATVKMWDQPISFTMALHHTALILYMIAQFNFTPKNNDTAAAPLLTSHSTNPTIQNDFSPA